MQKRAAQRIRRKKKNRMLLVLLVLVAFMVSGMVLLCGRLKQDISQRPQQNKLGMDSIDFDESNADGNNVDEEEWCLTLVNKWNPMETGGSEVETVELSNGQLVDKRIYPQLQKMFDDAKAAGIYPVVASGYRTQSKQEELYNEKIDECKAEGLSDEEAKEAAEYWVAIPGTSEHQLGLSVDINADGINSAGNEVYDWLAENAYKYGFINRYPPDKVDITGVANEPWHYRYVGIQAATEIYNQEICLEEYLENEEKPGTTKTITEEKNANADLEYVTNLQEQISKAMAAHELPFVVSSAVYENPYRLHVVVTSEAENDLEKLKAFDTMGGVLEIEYTSVNNNVIQAE